MINFVFFSIAAALCIAVNASAVKQLPVAGRMSAAALAELKAKIEAAGGCNLNVCFAIDGSGSISSQEFTNERFFVLDVSAVLVDNPLELGAVQYSTSVSTITDLTPDSPTFNTLVQTEEQLRGLSFVSGGISACFSQLSRRPGEANKIVLLGDGMSNIGASAVARADLFRSIGGSVCVVAAGATDEDILLDIAGGDADKVFQVDSFLDVLALEKIAEELALKICADAL
ncbi:von Willebrand factor A-like protein [Gracilaria domingensis]|nr:von Willebrand factor A-like protein [Gracilaria domingensis]